MLSPQPLRTKEELDRFYRFEVTCVRGEDSTARMAMRLRRAAGSVFFKAFLMGHSGVGKSTEISRLLCHVEEHYQGIRFSIASELNPACFKIFDILLLMMLKVAEEAKNELGLGLFEEATAGNLLRDVSAYFDDERVLSLESRRISGEIVAGAGLSAESFWAKLLGLFASVKGEVKYAADRRTESVEYRLKRLPDLVELCNRLLDYCGEMLRSGRKKEWLFVLEDFDKSGISVQQLQEVFVQYGTVFADLRAHLLFTIPVWMGYSDDANRLPFEKFMIHDTPVYTRDHAPHREGRAAVCTVLSSRVSAALFDPEQVDRLVVASGGNLRDLFSMVREASETALTRDAEARTICANDVTMAINATRREYRKRLGQNPYDARAIDWSTKTEKLLAVYGRDSKADIPDAVLYSLLRSRALQEFNGEGWFGVHPLVVDILKEQNQLKESNQGGTE